MTLCVSNSLHLNVSHHTSKDKSSDREVVIMISLLLLSYIAHLSCNDNNGRGDESDFLFTFL